MQVQAADNRAEHGFVPQPGSEREFREALGRFGTGVTIVTAAGTDGPAAITVNSFSSVSLSPPMVLWSLDRDSSRYNCFANARHYSIHVLSTEQQNLCMHVARDVSCLHDVEHETNQYGVPVLDNCLARFDCSLEAHYSGGDHLIVLGLVKRVFTAGQCEALAFYRGRIGRFAQL